MRKKSVIQKREKICSEMRKVNIQKRVNNRIKKKKSKTKSREEKMMRLKTRTKK